MKKQMTVTDESKKKIMSFIASEEQIDAANAVILAMTYTKVVRPVVLKAQQEVLDKNRYKWDAEIAFCGQEAEHSILEFINDHGEYCKSPKDSYMISDKDFGHYITEVQHKVTLAGIKYDGEKCPLLEAEHMEVKVKKHLINLMQPITGFYYDDFFNTTKWQEYIEKYVDLTLRWLAPHLKNTLV